MMRPFTPTQVAVIDMLAHGMTIAQIAEKRGTSTTAVTHIMSIAKQRLGSKNLAHTIFLAVARGVIRTRLNGWTPAETNALAAMRTEGLPISIIAETLRRSPGACRARKAAANG